MNELNLVLGLYDNPENQLQPYYEINLYRNNLAIFGTSMSGKTTLIKTILVRLHQIAKTEDVKDAVYILDFSRGLDEFKNMPFVASYCLSDNEDNIRILFKTLEERLKSNSDKLGEKIFIDSDAPPIHVTLIIDGINLFLAEEHYNVYHEKLLKLAREGISKGIDIIFTASEPSGLVNKLLPSFNRLIAFDLPKDKYMDVFSVKVEKPLVTPGRGLANIDGKVYEFQSFLPHVEESDKDLVEKVNGDMSAVDWLKECKITTLPDVLKPDNALVTGAESKDGAYENGVLVGLDYYSHKRVVLPPLNKAQSIAIYGKKNYGQDNLLKLIVNNALGTEDVKFVFWEDGRKASADIIEYIRSAGKSVEVVEKKVDFVRAIREVQE
ncbi:MAG: hypothetical protein LBT59_14815 [Clostridiales bacterium]|nr:hypothetical protein [Clostridiales bacterium]